MREGNYNVEGEKDRDWKRKREIEWKRKRGNIAK